MLCMVLCGYLFTVVFSGDALDSGLQLDIPFKGSLISSKSAINQLEHLVNLYN